MKILIVVSSKHVGNTRKIAEAMGDEAQAVVTDTAHARDYTFREFDIIGFGSGVYCGRPDKKIVELLKGICDKRAYSFVFSTSGAENGYNACNKALTELLEKKNKVVLGSFGCKGLDKFFILKLFGGTNKGLPSDKDLSDARAFIGDVMKKYEKYEKQTEV